MCLLLIVIVIVVIRGEKDECAAARNDRRCLILITIASRLTWSAFANLFPVIRVRRAAAVTWGHRPMSEW